MSRDPAVLLHQGDAVGWTKAEYDQCPDLANRLHSRILDLEDEVGRLRQGIWDCAIAAGMDHDGDLTPAHCATDVVEVALREVRQLATDYDEALEALP